MLGIIGAMEVEVEKLRAKMTETEMKTVAGMNFCKGKLEESQMHLLSLAHNVFAWNSRTSPTPHELSRLGYPWLEVALNAIFISGGNMKVQIQKNEKGIPELLLDVSSYEKTKQFHERFQQMQNDLDDEFDEEMEQ